MALGPAGAGAQATPVPDSGAVDAGGAGEGFHILGRAPHRRRILMGLWSLHPYHEAFPKLDKMWGLGLQYDGWFGATFINSYRDRSMMFGIAREWVVRETPEFGAGAGFRVGFVTGYDEQLLAIAGKIPAVPMGGPSLWARAGPLYVDVFYVYRAITIETSVRW